MVNVEVVSDNVLLNGLVEEVALYHLEVFLSGEGTDERVQNCVSIYSEGVKRGLLKEVPVEEFIEKLKKECA